MKRIKTLFYGSRFEIKDYIKPQQATDKLSSENCQNGVYATDIFEVAKGMSLTGEQWAYANYNDKDFKIIFVEEPPTPSITRYVYEIDAKDFIESPKGSHQFVSFKPAKILKVHTYTTEDLKDYWRQAIKEEREEMYKRHNS